MTLEELEELDICIHHRGVPCIRDAVLEHQLIQSGIAVGREESDEIIKGILQGGDFTGNRKAIRSQIIHDAIEVGEPLKVIGKPGDHLGYEYTKSDITQARNGAISDYQECLKKLL